MDSNPRPSLRGLKVASFESRRAKEMAELIRRYGAEPVVAPSLREVPLSENRAALAFLPELEAGKFDFLVLMTGIGTRTLNETLRTQFPQERILSALRRVQLVVRGPKPFAVLKELGLVAALTVPEPNTWHEVLATLEAAVALRGKRIAVQEYGVPNTEFVAALRGHGVHVTTIPVYRWALPEDLAPLRAAIRRIVDGQVDAALFTNGAQVEHLFRVAAEDKLDNALREALERMVVGSVGPVCTQVLRQFGLKPDFEPAHPKMGALLAETAARTHRLLAAKHAS